MYLRSLFCLLEAVFKTFVFRKFSEPGQVLAKKALFEHGIYENNQKTVFVVKKRQISYVLASFSPEWTYKLFFSRCSKLSVPHHVPSFSISKGFVLPDNPNDLLIDVMWCDVM